MCNSEQQLEQQQEEQRQRKIKRLFSSTLMRLSFLMQRSPQKQNYRQSHSNRYKNRHRHKHETRLYDIPRCGLGFLIFLSVIRDSITTAYSTSYSLSLDVTTMAPQTNFLPYFDFDVPRNITVTVGQTGFLHCRVERLGDKDVSWIRKRDLHILTAGSTTYTSDQRFQVLRPENSGNWTLQIKYPQPRDSGIYECQINTEPKMSLSYTFNVIELKATIIGPSDLYVKSGSDINLTCRIIQGPHELGNIFWYKGSEIIDMATNQNEIDSGTRITVENDWSDGLTSRLKIRRASSSDTGNYTCVPTIAKSSSVYAHVIIGEHPAAMQHNSSSSYSCNFYTSLCCLLFTILTCCLQYLTNTSSSTNNRKNFTRLKTTALATEAPSSTSIASLSMANATVPYSSTSASGTATATASKKTPAVNGSTLRTPCSWSIPPAYIKINTNASSTAAASASALSTATMACTSMHLFVCSHRISS